MEVETRRVHYESSSRLVQVTGVICAPVRQPKAVLQISHGMCEYIERYQDFMEYLARKGFVVCGNTHIGHRGSVQSDYDLGFLSEENGYNFLLTDLRTMNQLIRKEYPGLPVVLLGHSMGSFAARIYAERYSRELDALILSGTGGRNPAVPIGIQMAKAVAAAKGGHYRSKLLNKMAFGTFNNKYDSVHTQFDWISRDERMVEKYYADPYCNFIFTASGMKDLFTLHELANRKEWFQKFPKQLPVLLFSGDMDPVGDYGKGVRQVYRDLVGAGVQDVSLQLYPGGRHEMINELNRDEVYEDVAKWMSCKVLKEEECC